MIVLRTKESMDHMYLFLAGACVICFLLGAAFFAILRRLASPDTTLPLTPEWISDLSADRYRPMLRLLDEEELRSMATHPGFDKSRLSRMRAERCGLFRGYLRSMKMDFSRICMAIELLMVQSQHDRPDLAATLLQQKARFTIAMIEVYFRLVLFRCGCGSVPADLLVNVFDSMRVELRQLMPASAFSQI